MDALVISGVSRKRVGCQLVEGLGWGWGGDMWEMSEERDWGWGVAVVGSVSFNLDFRTAVGFQNETPVKRSALVVVVVVVENSYEYYMDLCNH